MKRRIAVFLVLCCLIGTGAAQGDIRMNEFRIKGGEWVEFYNSNSTAFDLNGCSLTMNGNTFEFTDERVPAHGFRAVETHALLDNNGGTLFLRCNGAIIDQVSYGYAGYAPAPPSYDSCAFVDGDWNLDRTPTREEENDVPSVALGDSIRINEYYEKSIEFYNPENHSIDTENFFVSDGDRIFYLSGIIDPRDVIAIETDITVQDVDVLYLFNDSGELIDMVGYYGHNLRESLQRIPDGNPVFGYSWETSELYDTYESLGSLNDFFIISEVSENFIELYTPISREISFSLTLETKRDFTRFVDEFLIISNNDNSFFEEFGFHSDIVFNESFDEIVLEYKGTEDHLSYDQGTVARKPITPTTEFIETKPTPGEYNRIYALDPPLVLTEIMYNPAQSDYYYEWIEVYNRTDNAYDPADLYFGDDRVIGDPIPSHEHAVIADENTKLFNAIEIQNALKADGNLSLSNSGDYIVIKENEIILDEMSYAGGIKEGYSLVRVNGSWRKGIFGGTPGYAIQQEEKKKYGLVVSVFAENNKLEKKVAHKIEEMEETLISGEEFLSIKDEFENITAGFIGKNRKLKELQRRLDSLTIYEKNVLFLESKNQYYTMNESLKKRLNAEEIELSSCSTFPKLNKYDVIFLTNPGEDFTAEEIQRLERYMENGGVLVLCGTYHTYLNTDLNRISEKYGTKFIKSSFRDDKSNSGKNYYVRVTELPNLLLYKNIDELNISGGVLVHEGCTALLKGNESSYAVTENESIEEFAVITLKGVGDGWLLCSGSSQMFTTGIYYGDNLQFTVDLIKYMLQKKHTK
ncbi:MAG: Gldg family protein [Euryarchaeota archaeon]|nr:Gldg family protein [Euryarchaeota archaeon]